MPWPQPPVAYRDFRFSIASPVLVTACLFSVSCSKGQEVVTCKARRVLAVREEIGSQRKSRPGSLKSYSGPWLSQLPSQWIPLGFPVGIPFELGWYWGRVPGSVSKCQTQHSGASSDGWIIPALCLLLGQGAQPRLGNLLLSDLASASFGEQAPGNCVWAVSRDCQEMGTLLRKAWGHSEVGMMWFLHQKS